MAEEPWNRVNISFPGAVSTVCINFSSTTGTRVKTLLSENQKVLQLLQSEILQTEIRMLYELLYILNNSFRGNKTLKSLKQVEQCVNRLKNMKLDVALKELTELCPKKVQRNLSINTGECDVPSQPMLEWICLKVLGAAQLMSCTLNRCSRAFVFSKQQMKLEEFIVLNVVITSMLSRLWVMFRGILVCMSTLYQRLLEFLREVALAQPMPFLTDFSLPADLVQFLCPSDALLLSKHPMHGSHAKDQKRKGQKIKKPFVKVKTQRQVKEDLGVTVERGVVHDTDMKPFLKVIRNFTEGKAITQGTHKADKRQKFKKKVREATSFADMAAHLEEMIPWYRSQRMDKEKRLLTFLRLKCHKMKCLEDAGYNTQRKLQSFRQDVCWATFPRGPAPRTRHPSTAGKRKTRMRTRCQSLKSQVKTGVKGKHVTRRRRSSELSVSGLSKPGQRNKAVSEPTPQTTDCERHDDIDDIFASIGL